MIADHSIKMFAINLNEIKADQAAPFPLYIHMPLNKRYILYKHADETLETPRITYFLEKKLEKLWIPEEFRDKYLQYIQQTGQEVVEPKVEATPEEEIFEETEIVHDVIQDQELTAEEKGQILSALSQDVLRSFNQINTRGDDAKKEGLKRCRQIADEILIISAQNSNIYDEIVALRSSQEDLEHSIIVGTMAVMFGMALAYSDENLLSDLTMAGIFHDIGLVRVNREILIKHEKTWTAPERQEYETHIKHSLDILKESEANFPERIFRMIQEHHENYDGSGFPAKRKGVEIDELSQVLHLANWFDRLSSGKVTGEKLAPAECFEVIFETAMNVDAVKEVQPEIIQRIFQFMTDERDAAQNLLSKAKSKTNTMMDSLPEKQI